MADVKKNVKTEDGKRYLNNIYCLLFVVMSLVWIKGFFVLRVGVKHELDRSSGDDVDAPPLKRIKRESILPKGLSLNFT